MSDFYDNWGGSNVWYEIESDFMAAVKDRAALCLWYAKDVESGRFEDGEDSMRDQPEIWAKYIEHLRETDFDALAEVEPTEAEIEDPETEFFGDQELSGSG